MADKKVQFTRVPLGGGGLVPNLLSGNVDAVVLYSPLTYRVMQEKTARSILDFGGEVPPHATGIWLATDKMLAEKPQLVQKVTNALLGAMESLRADRAAAIKLISEINEIPEAVSAAELDGNLLKLSQTGELKPEWVDKALEMAKLVGMTNLAEAKDVYVTSIKGVPTKK
jgi:NitT/TauT family transport system substrate-binding protein